MTEGSMLIRAKALAYLARSGDASCQGVRPAAAQGMPCAQQIGAHGTHVHRKGFILCQERRSCSITALIGLRPSIKSSRRDHRRTSRCKVPGGAAGHFTVAGRDGLVHRSVPDLCQKRDGAQYNPLEQSGTAAL